MICGSSARSSSGAQHFTVACVPTGMKIGVSITPRAVCNKTGPGSRFRTLRLNLESHL